jgi:hypothetical protein
MYKKVLILTAILLVFSACKLQADVTHSTWVGGEQDAWGRASNWNPHTVPDNSSWRTFVVTIDSNSIGIDEITVGLQQSRTIDQLDCYGTIELASWADWVLLTLTDPNGLTNYGDLSIDEINIDGNITNTNSAALNLVDLDVAGDLNNPAGGTTKIEIEVWVDGDVENAGSMIIVPAGTLFVEEVGNTFHNTGQFQLYNGCCMVEDLFHNDSNGVIQGFGVFFADQLRNKGKIYAYGGSLAISCESLLTNTGVLSNKPLSSLHIKPAEDLNNLGTIEINAGGGIAFDCNIVNEPNAVIKLMGGTLAAKTITQKADAHFTGQGDITGDLAVESDALVNLTGPAKIFGNIEINPDGKLEISDGSTLITGSTTNNGVIHVVNGDVVFQGGYSGSGKIIYQQNNNSP